MSKTITITSEVAAGSKNVSVLVTVAFGDGGIKDYVILGPSSTLFGRVFPNDPANDKHCTMRLFGSDLGLEATVDTIDINGETSYATGLSVLTELAKIIRL